MQLPLTKSPLLRVAKLCVAGLFLAAVTAPPQAHAQSRRAKASTSKASNPNAKIQALQARLRKAIATYNNAFQTVNGRAVFQVLGKIQSGNTSRLVVYGKTYGQNNAAASALGQNNDDNFLTIHNADPQRIMQGMYQGNCIALSQTEFTPAPASYFQAVATLDKYREIIASLESEIEFGKRAQQQAIRKREQAKVAKVKQAEQSRRDRVYGTRAALAKKEAAAKLVQLDGVVTGASDKGSAYLQSSVAAMALFNKWGNLGVSSRALLERTFDDLANAAAWQVERGDWKGAMQTAEKLLSLDAFGPTPNDAQTGRERIELGVDANDSQMPSNAVGSVMHRNGKEPAAASKLARVWLEKLPTYIAGPATREEKLRVAKLSQLLGAEVFATDAGRSRTIALAVDAVRGTYGPGALAVLPQFVASVEAAKRERVARQVESFSQPRVTKLPAANAPVAAPIPVSPSAGRSWMDREPLEDAPANAPQVPAAPIVQVPATPEVAKKPVERQLVPALDFTLRSLVTGKKARLSEFKGKTVLLYFWDVTGDNRAKSPTPAEQLFALSQRYAPQKVVLLLVDENGDLNGAREEYLKAADPTPDANRDRGRGYGPRRYPNQAYTLEIGVLRAAGDVPPEREVAEAALELYSESRNVSKNAMRVTVINPALQIVGSVDFQVDNVASMFNAQQVHLDRYQVYDLNEAALEDLLVRAMGPQP